MELFATEHPFTTGRDISSWAFWGRSLVDRDETFAWLRANAPVSWHRPLDESPAASPVHTERGFWAVTRAADINYVSQNHRLFSSQLGGILLRPRMRELDNAPTMLATDPPLHTAYRSMISSFFTPKGVAGLQEKLDGRARTIVDAVVGAGEFDLVEAVSAKLPMLTVADMVGVPESLVAPFTQAGNDIMALSSDQVPEGVSRKEFHDQAMGVIEEIALDLVAHRREHPADDIATALARGEVDGRPITDDEITATVSLLASAGNDTTRHTTTWTVWNLWSNPEQKAWLVDDFEGRINLAVDEFVRHATVVNFFARTAAQDAQIAGTDITAGDKIALLYCSGNRDDAVFSDPHRFDLQRPRANHVAFGGRGVHFCLGNVVARAQLRTLFRELLTRIPGLELRGEPQTFHIEAFNAVAHLPVST